MSWNIKDPAVHKPGTERNLARVMSIARQIAAFPVLDARSADEIPGYDETRVPR